MIASDCHNFACIEKIANVKPPLQFNLFFYAGQDTHHQWVTLNLLIVKNQNIENNPLNGEILNVQNVTELPDSVKIPLKYDTLLF